MAKTKQKVHWVDQYLVPLNACEAAVIKARQYADPQSAWDAWDNGADMLWLLQKLKADKSKRIFCDCDIAERVLPIFERRFPDDHRPRKAIEAARAYALRPTVKNREATTTAVFAARSAIVSACDADAVNAAYAAYVAVYAATNDDTNIIYAAVHIAHSAELKAQADIVRKYFPQPPIRKNGKSDRNGDLL